MKTNNWWDNLEVTDKPYPHIPRKHIMAVMPIELHEKFNSFIYGQTCLLCDNGDSGIYEWDWERFISKYKRGEPLEDTAAEWD